MPYTSLKGRPIPFATLLLNFTGQITEDFLGFVERTDDRAGFTLVLGNPFVKFGELLGGELIRLVRCCLIVPFPLPRFLPD